MKIKVISLPYIFQVLYVLCFTRPRYQVIVYWTIGRLVLVICGTTVKFSAIIHHHYTSLFYFEKKKKIINIVADR